MSGMFFSFDGVDGVGKTTQMNLFCDWLESQGRVVVTCRDPGSTPLGESIRGILLDRHDLAIARRAEMFLYMAARSQLVDEVIRPALLAAKTVVSDRYLLANAVYQGHAGGLDVPTIWSIGQTAIDGVRPDLTFLLDMDVDAASQRIRRPPDRMESQGDEFRRQVRRGFLAEASRCPAEIAVIDANRAVTTIQAEIRARAAQALRQPIDSPRSTT